MGELTLQAYHKEHGLKAACGRYFTVYGPRGSENHAVVAIIALAFVGQNPFEVWGDGRKIRNSTYIDDIVWGTILAAKKIDEARPVNLGTMERIRVMDGGQDGGGVRRLYSGNHAAPRHAHWAAQSRS